ncbi:hypothetical protein ACWEO2_31385 [Nocardia sp. NPDC004278]
MRSGTGRFDKIDIPATTFIAPLDGYSKSSGPLVTRWTGRSALPTPHVWAHSGATYRTGPQYAPVRDVEEMPEMMYRYDHDLDGWSYAWTQA